MYAVRRPQANAYLSFDDNGFYYNPLFAKSGVHQTNGVNWAPPPQFGALPSNISVTVCAWWLGQWRCGEPYSASGSI
jgi:hypothetical protein